MNPFSKDFTVTLNLPPQAAKHASVGRIISYYGSPYQIISVGYDFMTIQEYKGIGYPSDVDFLEKCLQDCRDDDTFNSSQQ